MDRETDDQTKQQWQFRLVGIWSCYGVGQHELLPPVLRLLVQHDGPGREALSSVDILAAPAPEPPPWPGAAPPRGPVLAPSAAVQQQPAHARPTRRPRADGTHARQLASTSCSTYLFLELERDVTISNFFLG